MKIYNTLEGVDKYRNHPNKSQSDLKAFMDGKTYSGKPSLAIELGSYIDCLLTLEPGVAKKVYWPTECERPNDTIMNILYKLKQFVPENKPLREYGELLENFMLSTDYYANRSPTQRAENLIKHGEDWWQEYIDHPTAVMISKSDADKMEQQYLRIINSALWKKLPELGDIYFQKDFYWERSVKKEDSIMQVDLKGLADFIVVTDKEILEFDLKFTECSTIEMWLWVAKEKNYPFQKAFYKEGLERNFNLPVKSYWLVISQNFMHMVNANQDVLNIGSKGLERVNYVKLDGKVLPQVSKISYGYEEALEQFCFGKPKHPFYLDLNWI